MMLHAHAWLKLCLPLRHFLISSFVSTARFFCCSPLCLHPPYLLFLAHAQRRFNQKPAPIHTALEVTVLRNPNLAQVMSPKRLATRRLSTSLTRSSLNKRVSTTARKITSTTLLKRVRKALPHLMKETWTTNEFVLCWLHHGTCRSEKQVRNDHKFITLKEKV